MLVQIYKNHVMVFRELGDKAFYGIVNAKGESALLYAIKKHLNERGYDLIKKRMCKDGHLVDDMQQYLRPRKPSGNSIKDIYIYNGSWAIEGAEKRYNAGSVRLELCREVFTG